LESNKQFYIDSYNKLVKENNDKIDAAKKEMEAQATLLKTSILEDKNSFKDLNVDNVTRRKIYDNITKPIYKDPTTKKSYTAIQKYALDNPADF
jgi:pyoverdine/dityrosine biosynthesis protein Dit1